MEIGIRAVIQHLKCYASKEPLKEKCVDPRWNDALRGKAIYIEYLGYADNPYKKGWAYPGKGYGEKVLIHLNKIKNIGKEEEMTEENITLKRNNAINKSLSIILNLLLIYLLFLIFHKMNKKDKIKKSYKKFK